jgi:hypothetical protein
MITTEVSRIRIQYIWEGGVKVRSVVFLGVKVVRYSWSADQSTELVKI